MDLKSASPSCETLTEHTQPASDRRKSIPLELKSAPLELKSAPFDEKSTSSFEDAAESHGKSTPSRNSIAPLDTKLATAHGKAAPPHTHLLSIDVEDATVRGPNVFHRVKSARIRSERHKCGADAANEQAQRSRDDPKGPHDHMKTAAADTKTATAYMKTANPRRIMSAARPAGAPLEDVARREHRRAAR